MLKFLEIKKDVANGHGYMEYEGNWKGYEYCIILDVIAGDVIFSFVDDESQAVFSIEINKFLDIMWYKDYIKLINECLYYHSIPLEINF